MRPQYYFSTTQAVETEQNWQPARIVHAALRGGSRPAAEHAVRQHAGATTHRRHRQDQGKGRAKVERGKRFAQSRLHSYDRFLLLLLLLVFRLFVLF